MSRAFGNDTSVVSNPHAVAAHGTTPCGCGTQLELPWAAGAGIVAKVAERFPPVAFLRLLAILAPLPLHVPACGAEHVASARENSPPVEVAAPRACKCCQRAKPDSRKETPVQKSKAPRPAKPCCPNGCTLCTPAAILTPERGSPLAAEDAPPAWVAGSFASSPHAGFRSLLDRPPRA